MPKIVVASIGAAGCYLSPESNASYHYESDVRHHMDAIDKNQALIKEIVASINPEDELVLMCGDKRRQDLKSDHDHALLGKKNFEQAGTGSFYGYLELLQAYLIELGVKVRLDKFLLADKVFFREEGATWNKTNEQDYFRNVKRYKQLQQRLLKAKKNEKEAIEKELNILRNLVWEVFEDVIPKYVNDVPMVKEQILKISGQNTDKEIEYRFYANGKNHNQNEFNPLIAIPNESIPRNVTLVLLKYDPHLTSIVQEVARKKGTGPIVEYVPVSSTYNDLIMALQNEIIGNNDKVWKTGMFGGVVRTIKDRNGKPLGSVTITNTMNEILNELNAGTKKVKLLNDFREREAEYKKSLLAIARLLNQSYSDKSKNLYSIFYGRTKETNDFYLKWRDKLYQQLGLHNDSLGLELQPKV